MRVFLLMWIVLHYKWFTVNDSQWVSLWAQYCVHIAVYCANDNTVIGVIVFSLYLRCCIDGRCNNCLVSDSWRHDEHPCTYWLVLLKKIKFVIESSDNHVFFFTCSDYNFSTRCPTVFQAFGKFYNSIYFFLLIATLFQWIILCYGVGGNKKHRVS